MAEDQDSKTLEPTQKKLDDAARRGEVASAPEVRHALALLAMLAATQQLVQYSQVEQSIQQTAVLRTMLDRLSADDLTSAGQLIGRTVEFDSSVSGLTADHPAEWRWTASAKPATIEAEILDSSGRVVARPEVAPDASGSFRWDGTLSTGGRAGDGAYVLKITAKAADGATIPATLTSLGKVAEVVSRDGELWAGLGSVALPMAKLVRIAA